MKAFFNRLWSRIWTRKIKLTCKVARWIVEAQLLFLVSQEAGPWTAACLGLVVILLEGVAWSLDGARQGLTVVALMAGALQEDFQQRKQARFRKGLKK